MSKVQIRAACAPTNLGPIAATAVKENSLTNALLLKHVWDLRLHTCFAPILCKASSHSPTNRMCSRRQTPAVLAQLPRLVHCMTERPAIFMTHLIGRILVDSQGSTRLAGCLSHPATVCLYFWGCFRVCGCSFGIGIYSRFDFEVSLQVHQASHVDQLFVLRVLLQRVPLISVRSVGKRLGKVFLKV